MDRPAASLGLSRTQARCVRTSRLVGTTVQPHPNCYRATAPLAVRTLRLRKDFLHRKSTKPGFLAEIRASALVAARDGWLTPFVVPPGCSLRPDSTNDRGLDDQTAHRKRRVANQTHSIPRGAAVPGRQPWLDGTVCRQSPDSVLSRMNSWVSYAFLSLDFWLRETDLNRRPPGYEPDALPTALSRF